MSRLSRTAAALFIVALAAMLLPGAYTSSSQDDPTGEDPASAEASPTPTPEPSSTPTEDPEEPEATPSPSPSESSPPASPSPEPSPDPTPTEAPPEEDKPVGAQGEQSQLHLSLGVSPATIYIGEETTIGAVLTNPGDEPLDDVDLVVTLPKELDHLGSSPNATSVSSRGNTTTLTFSSLSIRANGSRTVAIFAEGAEETKAPASVDATAFWSGEDPTESAEINIEVPESDLEVETSGPGLLSVVGENVTYDISIRNAGEAPLSDVSIVNLVPAEVHVIGAGLSPGIDAVQVGSTGEGAEDIVWAITELDAGEVIDVSYLGVVEKAGDLEAVNTTRVLSSGVRAAETSERSYLAAPGGTGSTDPSFEPITERSVVREKVVERPLIRRRLPTEPGGLPATGALPFSGIDPWGIAGVGLALIGFGALLVRFGSRGTDRRRVLAATLLVFLIGGACISSDPESSGPGDTRVKGKEIERDDQAADGSDSGQPSETDDVPDGDGSSDEGPSDEDGSESSDDEDPGAAQDSTNDDGAADDGAADDGESDVESSPEPETEVVLVPGPPVTTFERTVTTTTLTEKDLKVVSLDSIDDASRSSFTWNDGGGVGGGSSSSSHQGVVEMTTTVVNSGPGMRATVVIENVAERLKVAVAGRLSLVISGASGGTLARLNGGAVDAVLTPSGESTASFTFRLPSGAYGVQGVFGAE